MPLGTNALTIHWTSYPLRFEPPLSEPRTKGRDSWGAWPRKSALLQPHSLLANLATMELRLIRPMRKNLAVLTVCAGALCLPPLVDAQTWTLTSAPTNEFWQTVVSSADGAKLYAVSST